MAEREYMEGQHYSATLGQDVYDVTVAMSGGAVTGLEASQVTAPDAAGGTFADTALYTFKDDLEVVGELEAGSMLSNGPISLSGTASIEHGAGDPEGVTTANPGSVYLNSSGGINEAVYQKLTGTGNTGWQAMASAIGAAAKYHQTWTMPTTNAPSPAYLGGYYDFASSDNDFSPSVSWGISLVPACAHFMIVTGAETVDDVTITITGDSISDSTSYVASDTATIVIPSGTPIDTYFETPKKWLGTINIETTAGTAVTCNYGWCKYWDNGNTDFTVVGGEALWMGDTSATIDIILFHHKDTGWTFNAGSEPEPPSALFKMSDVHGPNVRTSSNNYGNFKRVAPVGTLISGSASEGVIAAFEFSSGACIEYGQLTLEYTQ